MYKIVVSFIIAIVLTSCSPKKPSSIKKLRVNQKREIVDLAQKADSVFYVIPQKEVPFINNISKILFTNEHMLIKDQSFINNRPIFSINYQGEFEKQYGNIGRGPGEYLSAFDIALQNSTKDLYLYDRDLQNLLTFDLTTGELTEKREMPFFMLQLMPLEENILASLNDEEGEPEISIRELKKDKNLLEQYTHNELTDIEIPKVFAKMNDTNLFLRPSSDTIQLIQNHKLQPLLHIDFGKYAIDHKFKELEGDVLKRQYMKNNRLCLLTGIVADENNLLINYLQQDKTHYLLLQNNAVKLHVERFQYRGKDLPKPIGLWKGHLVFCLFPELFPNEVSPTHKNFYLAFFKIRNNS